MARVSCSTFYKIFWNFLSGIFLQKIDLNQVYIIVHNNAKLKAMRGNTWVLSQYSQVLSRWIQPTCSYWKSWKLSIACHIEIRMVLTVTKRCPVSSRLGVLSLLFESDILQKLRHYSVSEIINFWCLQIHFFASYSHEVKNLSVFVSEKGYVVNFLPIYPIKSL